MGKRQAVLDALRKIEQPVIPYHLDLSNKVRERLIGYFGDTDFERKVGNYLVLARNESFELVNDHRERDMFGVVWNKDQEGDFGVVADYLLKDISFHNYSFPTPDESLIRRKCEKLATYPDEAFRLYTIGFSLFERAWTLRGMENLLMDFILAPAFVEELFERIVSYNLAVVDIVCEYKEIDCVFFGDDWGQQKGLIMGPTYWRKFIKPYLAKMSAHVKDKGLFVAQHSCGDIQEIFPDLVDIGMDIYNTFQPEIFDVEYMKREYGRHVTFYGGISTQRLLPTATPDQVKREMRRLMAILGKGGGYIVAPTHAMPNDVPTENILAFLDVVRHQ